jgi:hypothetical protein
VQKALKALGANDTRQPRIRCRCKGFNDANKKCEAAGLGHKVFDAKYSMVDTDMLSQQTFAIANTDIIIYTHPVGKTFVTIEELLAKIEELKKSEVG